MANKEFEFIRNFNIFLAARKASRKRKIVWIAVSFLVLFFFLFIFGGNYGLINMLKLTKEKKALLKDIEALEKQGKELKKNIEKLKSDKKEVERIARENYGMAKKGEKVFKFVKPRDKKQTKGR